MALQTANDLKSLLQHFAICSAILFNNLKLLISLHHAYSFYMMDYWQQVQLALNGSMKTLQA